jgi:imidazolonepropionase-like amidohydrolase
MEKSFMRLHEMGSVIDQEAFSSLNKKRIVFICILFMLFMPFLLTGQAEILAIKGGRIQTVTNGIIEKGVIIIQGDKIIDLGPEVEIPPQAEVYEFLDHFIMPGVVSPDSNLGIPPPSEEDLAAAIRTGPRIQNLAFYPVLYSIYPEHPDYRIALMFGITTLALSPPPAGIAGLGAVIKPGGERFQDILIKDKAFLKVNVYVNTPFWDMMKKALEEAKKQIEEKRKKEEEKKKAEDKKDKDKKGIDGEGKKEEEEERIEENTRIFMEVVEGKLPLLAECPTPGAASHFLALISGYPQVKAVVRGGPDTYQAGSLLKEKNIPIILEPALSQVRDFTEHMERTNYVLKCQDLGLEIAFQAPGGREEQIHLFDYLNKLALYGVRKDVLLKGVTIVPAKILGLDKQLGSLEKGKMADLIVFKDDPLENIPVIERVISGGKFVR